MERSIQKIFSIPVHFALYAALIGLLYKQAEVLFIRVNSGWVTFWHPFIWLGYAISAIIIYFFFSIILRVIYKRRTLYSTQLVALFFTGLFFIWIGVSANVNLAFIHSFEIITTPDWILQLGLNLILLLVPIAILSAVILNKLIRRKKNKPYPSVLKFAKRAVPILIIVIMIESLFVSFLLKKSIINSSMNPTKPLNVILISVDTLRKDHLSIYGYARQTSPNLDKFLKQGIRFERCIAPLPSTAPNYTSIYTGTYPFKHFVFANGFSFKPKLNHLTTLAQELGKNGYYCSSHLTGSLVGTGTNLDLGLDDLYQRSVKVISSGGYDLYTVVHNLFAYIDSFLDRKNMSRHLGPETIKAIRWLESGIREPFYTHFYWHWPHSPYGDRRVKLPEDFFYETVNYEPYPNTTQSQMDSIQQIRERYDSDIYYTDIQIGAVLNALEQNGYMDRSIIIFTSDHGEDLGERFHLEQPFFGHAYWLYESSTCVPLIFLFPTEELSNQKVIFPVSSIDIFPTVLNLLHLPISDTNQGEYLFKGSLGSLCVREELASLRPFILSFNFSAPKIKRDFSSIFSDRYTLHRTENSKRMELYDVTADYHSTQNILHDYSEVADALQNELDIWLQRHNYSHRRVREKTFKEQSMPERLKKKLRSLGYIK